MKRRYKRMAKDRTEDIAELMKTPEFIRNIGIAAHIDHGKTTFTDNILAGAGMISEELAGQQLFTDFDKQEQERGITIFSANVSMIHDYEGRDYLINLIDTPGHVDFGGDVTRAMRAVDGAIILVDAVEAVMPQTETVVRQALHERVKPVLFINKVDRLIRELKLTPEQMQQRFVDIIMQVNRLIQKYGEPKFVDKYLVKVDDGSVAFGSAYRNWAISVPFMKRANITFKDIIELSSTDRDKELAKRSPLHKIVLDMVIRHLPNPLEAQKYRVEKIWHGDTESDIGKSMLSMNPNGPLAMIITKVVPDPHAGIVATARLFSGAIERGQEVRLISQHQLRRVQQVSIYKGPQRIQMEKIPAGNIIGIVGLNDAFSGETVCDSSIEMEPFEAIKHMFEPVVTKSIECKDPKDLPKLIIFLRQVSREDPTLVVKINEETGEYLVSGLGELHIDAKIERPIKEKGIEITASTPIVIYRETVRTESVETEGKSSNKHNRFYLTVEPLEEGVYKALAAGTIDEENVRKYIKTVVPKLVEAGMGRDEAKRVYEICNRNVFVDATKGIQYLNETIELVVDAFKQVMKEGPLCGEPCTAIKVRLTDAKLHEDAIHRGPAQVIPAVNDALRSAVHQAKPTLLEPVQTIRVDVPEELISSAMSQVQNRRGQILDTHVDAGAAIIQAKMPVAEMFGFEAQLKSATGGRGFYSLIDVTFEKIPEDLKMPVITKIRERKGMSKEFRV
ncbi:MAG: elongation factor EF-2 [Candidatus Aenigmatarchaeota archaeon]